ncbi:MAG: chemotaxis response regulator protein-glutamate methylesterase [Polyangiaceae bacterium]
MPTRVLVVDDSALMRKLLTSILGQDPELEVVGTATDPVAAKRALAKLSPDVMTLDIEMPHMNGIQFLEQLMRHRPMPVVMVSSLTERGSQLTLQALRLGAFDFVAKPKIDIARGTIELAEELVAKVKAAGRSRGRRAAPRPRSRPPTRMVSLRPLPGAFSQQALIAIGASTGGTEALSKVLSSFPANCPPCVVVQHMPPVFTRHFAERLDRECRAQVREAQDGEVLTPGLVLIAPGGERHMQLTRSGPRLAVQLVSAPPLNHHRPSVDVLFDSVARVAGPSTIAALLTGMGADGARGMKKLRDAGAHTVAQDEATSVVFGMPKEAIALGGAAHVAPLGEIAATLLRLAAEARRRDSLRVSNPPRGAT